MFRYLILNKVYNFSWNAIRPTRYINIILQISSLFIAVIMKESLFVADKKLLKDLFKNSICDCDWVIDIFFIISDYFWLLVISVYHWFFCSIDNRDLVPIQVFLISLMFSLKDLVKYFSFALLRSVDKRFL